MNHQIKISIKSVKQEFHPCTLDYIQNVCHGSCCESHIKGRDTLITIHNSEIEKIENIGGVVKNNLLQSVNGKCPFKIDGLCSTHGTPNKPFGCIASPFTLNNSGTLIVRNRYRLLKCYKEKTGKIPVYEAHKTSLILIFGEELTEKIIMKVKENSTDFFVKIPEEKYKMLIENDNVKKNEKLVPSFEPTEIKTIPVTCTSSHLVEIENLQPIQGELKKRSREQLYSLRSLIIKHGFSFPIYIWDHEGIFYTLDGHGRDFISKQLLKEGYLFEQKDGEINSKLPAIFIDAKNRAHAKEKLLAVNSSFGTVTEEGLFSFLFEPDFELKFDEVITTLSLPDISLKNFEIKYLSVDEKQESKEYKYIFTQAQLKESIKEHFPTFNTTQDIIDGIIDIPLAMHQFNLLCSGKRNVGSEISLLFNPHRFETKINNRKYSVADSFINKDKGLLSSLSQWMSKQLEVVHHRNYIIEAKVGTGTQIAHEFKPYLAREIYLDYCNEGAKVLDPCAGWGGRMIGFASALIGGEYFATDPATKTYQGLLKMKDFLLGSEIESKPELNIFNEPFENLELKKEYFDFAFTSPPYFDTEKYSEEETQAFNRFNNIEEFNQQFLTKLISNTIEALKPNGKFLMNIGGSQYRFDLVVNEICRKLGLNVHEVFKYKIGRGDAIVGKYKGNKLENTIKANDLFFEISR